MKRKKMVDGNWEMGNGKWEMENGKWKMENGKKRFSNVLSNSSTKRILLFA
ncbi:MAG: hypothetical protein NTX22_09580 [Ignavibacteriales bacterium]|nr:hypothetical protein [Ignavibacteriales bacterium]